jgi:nucleoside-diphosphate-sugar epimerase
LFDNRSTFYKENTVMATTNNTHVIFGTGPAGSTLADVLHAQGKQVRAINRSGKATLASGVSVVAGDVLDVTQVRALTADAAVVYHCANVPYPQQVELIPRFGANIMDGAARANAKLVVLDTLYGYGETHGVPMTETTPYAATTRKGRMRAQLAQTYLVAHTAGTVQVALGRSADFFGPRVLNSALGDRVFPLALANKPVQLLGNLNLPHSYTYIGDVARGLATLGERSEALGQAWLLPVAPPITQRAMAQLIGEVLGRPVRIQRLPKLAIQAFGLFNAEMREFTEMFYQYTEPQIVVSKAFEDAFGWAATPLDVAVRATVHWYHQRTAAAPGAASPTG